MSKEMRMLLKIAAILAGLLLVAYILIVGVQISSKKQPGGEVIPAQDAGILVDALALEIPVSDFLEGEGFLTYTQFCDLAKRMAASKTVKEEARLLAAQYQKEFGKRYLDDYVITKEDFYTFYDSLLPLLRLEKEIVRSDVTVWGAGAAVTDPQGNVLPEDLLLTQEGVLSFSSSDIVNHPYQVIRCYRKEDILLTFYQVVSRGSQLDNMWLMEAANGSIMTYLYDCEVAIPYEKAEAAQREQIADLVFADGSLQKVMTKSEKVNGKILSIKDGQIELDNGTYPYEENLKVYRLFGKLSLSDEKELRIGYDFTDFVVANGKICAGLVTRDEAMESIRVVVKNTDFAGAYHEKVTVTADTDYILRYGSGKDRKEKQLSKGEMLSLDGNSAYFETDRIYIEPAVLTGRIAVTSIERAQGTPSYRGKMEIAKTSEGLVIVNELLLEEYLYSVVPSEMPASYPLEALKAQAVCARTYAYRNMMRSGVASFGAHVDDSAGFQVYNNIAENTQTTKAVKETAGNLLYYGETLCGSYYYSTSCGFGTDVNIWKSDNKDDTSYLTAKRIGQEDSAYTGENMEAEEVFRAFITQDFSEDFEAKEPWYRWRYEVEQLDEERIESNLKKRYEVNDKLVLSKNKEGDFESKEVKDLGSIQDISVIKRNAGGAADELLIQGSKSTVKVVSEHNIRYVLNNGSEQVVRNDGSKVAVPTLLPSGYFVIEVKKEEETVTGYELIGGGYGHGVGLSQNGARAMAEENISFQEILTFFYESCQVKSIY